jgi:hypothetical protein
VDEEEGSDGHGATSVYSKLEEMKTLALEAGVV